MVSTSARKAGGTLFDSRSGYDRFCASISIGLFTFPASRFSEFLIKLSDAAHW